MAWRLAKSLVQLRIEAGVVAPKRRKTYDGDIGDAAHAARVSRHNPYKGVVTALDLTHDPHGGFDCGSLFEFLRAYPHPNLEYMIHNRLVARRRNAWRAERYTGSNPHTSHIHVAVGRGTDGAPFAALSEVDNTDPWGLATWKGEEGMTPDEVRTIVREELEWGGTSAEIKTAESHLVRLGLISRGRPPAKGLTWGLFALLLSRVLKLLGRP